MPVRRDSRGRFVGNGDAMYARTKPKPRVEDRTAVAFVIDESGSMSHLSRTLPEEFRKIAGEVPRGNPTSVFFFSDRVRGPFPDMSLSWYHPAGNTALWDAISAALDHLEGYRLPSLLWVLTDGQENSSRMVSASAVRDRIYANRSWLTVAFAGPRGLAGTVHRQLGLELGNITEWDNTYEGTQLMAYDTVGATQSYFQSRSTGRLSVDNFYSNIKATTDQVARSLQNVSPNFTAWDVDREAEIKSFVENHGRVYAPGYAYYQLTKPEKVQTYKEILVKEKHKNRIYGGKEARNLLGLPYHQDIKVTPGNHGDFDIFVQSNSVNRKLVRGTKLLYRK